MLCGLFESCFETDLNDNDRSEISQALKLAPLPSSKGTLLLADKNDTPIQLLLCANIRRTATARLFPEEETASRRADLRCIVKKIYYRRCFNDLKNSLFHYSAAKAVFPDDFRDILKLARQTLVSIDLSSEWPVFKTTEDPLAAVSEKVFGPFPTRQAATVFIKTLQNAFDLCQMPQLIAHREKAKSCPYLQMDKCPGPCVGNISRQAYLEQINNAVDAASGNIEGQVKSLHEKMLAASEKTEFETAQNIKKRIDRLKMLLKNDYEQTTDMSKFKLLHIDRAAKLKIKKRRKQQLFTAFIIQTGIVAELGCFALEAFEHIGRLIDRHTPNLNPNQAKDILSITCYHLYRSTQQGVWLDCSKTIPATQQIIDAVTEKFGA